MAPSPRVDVMAPARSKRPRRRGVSAITTRPRAHTVSPMGTLTNITHRHDAHSVRSPTRHQAGGPAGGGDGGEQADGPHPLGTLGEHGSKQGQRRGGGKGGAHTLQGTCGQQTSTRQWQTRRPGS